MKTYAYVESETCQTLSAKLPGAYIGRDERPVAKHGDYDQWRHGKRATLKLINDGSTPYIRGCAAAVADLLDWR